MKKLKYFFLFLLTVALGISLTACNETESDNPTPKPNPSENIPDVDYVAQTKLNISVTSSSNFFGEEGIAFATLVRNVDGDTAVFIVNGQEVTARFLGVDTPESTGQVEEWGKTASKFTAGKLSSAESIIVQTDGGPAQFDSTGSRYLMYIWYRTSATEDYRLLNLELIQEGLSYGHSATATKYAKLLVDAQQQAMRKKLRIFGDEKDPNFYYGDVIETTIKYIVENKTKLIEDVAKVKFDCTVVRVDGLYVYVQDYDAEEDQIYSILLYKGYNLHTEKLVVGNRVSIYGNVQEYSGQVQITNMKDIQFVNSLDNIQILEKDYEILFKEITPADLDISNVVLSRCFVYLKNVKVESMYTTKEGDSAGAITIYGKCGNEDVTLRTSVLRDENKNLIAEDYFKDKTISVYGIVDTYDGKYQVKIVSVKDIAFEQ